MITATEESVHTINFVREIEIAAPIDIAWEAVLEELGPGGELPDGTPFPMKVERIPGGRWYRDLGEGAGHLWGHVQVIKPPGLLELCGPTFMSYPGVNFIQYRLSPIEEDRQRTRLKLTHRAMGLIPQADREGVAEGWEHGIRRIQQLAERLRRRA